MIKRSDASVKRFLTNFKINEPVRRLEVVYEDITHNEMTTAHREYLGDAITLYVLRLYTMSINRWGKDGDEVFRCLTDISDVKLPNPQREKWDRFLCLHGYAVPKTLKGDVDLSRVPANMRKNVDSIYLDRVCDALLENVTKAAERFN